MYVALFYIGGGAGRRGCRIKAHTLAPPHRAVIWKAIGSISTCDELPRITSPQHFHDIVVALASLPQCHSGGVRMLSLGVRSDGSAGGGGV